MKIGVISDTHNYFDPRIPKLFEGVDHILHAGDVGTRQIIQALEQIAPVTAVTGNTDDPGFRYPLTEVIELAGVRFLLHHIVNPHGLGDAMQDRITRAKPNVVVFGHTHRPCCETSGGILFFNPGYAGKTRFTLERSLAILKIAGQKIEPEFLPL